MKKYLWMSFAAVVIGTLRVKEKYEMFPNGILWYKTVFWEIGAWYNQ